MIRPVLTYPDRRLKAPAVPVRPGPAARRLARDLRETAAHHPRTVGLAATQIGAMWRMVFVDCTGHPKVPDPAGPLILANPVVVWAEGGEEGREGCLSLPEITANVRRPTRVRVTATDEHGVPGEWEFAGFEARVVLHEIDHLDGVLILDRVASLARDVFPRRSGRGGASRGRRLVERAAMLARLAHTGQRYGDDPYEVHLAAVAGVLAEAGVDDPELVAAAWLHDVVEDTPVTTEDLAGEFGARVAAVVDAVSLRPDLPPGAARPDSWSRIAPTPGAVLVKLADRVANVRAGGSKAGRYVEEQPRFRAALADADPGEGRAAAAAMLWAMLDAALAAVDGRDPADGR